MSTITALTDTQIRTFNRAAAKASDLDALMPLCLAILEQAGMPVAVPAAHECDEAQWGDCAECDDQFLQLWEEVRESMESCAPDGHRFGLDADGAEQFGFWPIED
jgi:hypothetical protein